jgi:peroxidase
VRVNQHPGITMVQNLLLREHNRIADTLQRLNPEWSDEIVYQESRRIVAAEIQHITYNEWLPLILGDIHF